MKIENPSILQMIRAPFLSAIIAPLVAGTLLAVNIHGSLNVPAFILVLITGIGLHVATNVYNDIYDTIQGPDKVNVHRNEFSGGSGVLISNPELMGRMHLLARLGLILALIGTIALMYFIDRSLWVYLWGLFFLSAFFSKYYTAAPVKLAYRGLGEFSVWFAFGPMAVAIASISQNLFPSGEMLVLMPVTGFSTLTILLVGQLIDVDADIKGGKHGVASRLGTKVTALIYIFVQTALILNIVFMSFYFSDQSLVLLALLLPYGLLFPGCAATVVKYHDNPDELKAVAKKTVMIHLFLSLFLIAGLIALLNL